ncbi:hypothetical protein [Eubacterium aggregans]
MERLTRNEFMKQFWDYYLLLEEEFIQSLEYVELDKRNFGTFSK